MSPFVEEIKSLKKCPKMKELLLKLAKDVEPIMNKKGWKIRTLSEFYPKNPNLLGVNINRKDIKIRLRSAQNYDQTLDYHDLIGTMLHELTHMVFGPHDQKFYKLLDEIYTDYENINGFQFGNSGALKQSTVVLFTGKGRTLGAVPQSRGQRLGGQKTVKTMRELVLEAALRRQQDSKWCGSILIEDDVEGSGQGDSVIQEQGPSRPRPKPRPKREIIDLTGESGIQKSRKVEIVIID